MPAGRYAILDEGRRVGAEEFRSAPGPAGWRYFSEIETEIPTPHRETVDLAVDGGWRPARVRIRTGDHNFVGWPRGDRLAARLDGEALDIPFGPETEIDYLSPAFNLVTALRLDRTAEIDVVYLEPVTCRPRAERQRYELEGEETVETPVGTFDAVRWRFTSLLTGWTNPLWIAGEVVVAFQSIYELEALDPGPRGPVPR